jgi:hypothetical protein
VIDHGYNLRYGHPFLALVPARFIPVGCCGQVFDDVVAGTANLVIPVMVMAEMVLLLERGALPSTWTPF